MADEEYIDIYSRDMVFSGLTIPRKGAFLKEGQYMLYALAIVRDLQGRFLITRRALDKRWAAGLWEVPGGGVLAGETPLQGALREVREEVGLALQPEQGRLCYSYVNTDLARGDNYINSIFSFQADFGLEDVTLQASESIDCRLASWEEVTALEEAGQFLHYQRIRKALEG
ncbi:MAG: NUDIX domain-containing protein [Coriobacteriales bacterium]